MAAFASLKLGGWAYGEILTSAQMNQLNTDFPFALNLRDGGSYTPSNHVSLQTPAAKNVVLNSCTLASAASGGQVTCAGNLTAASLTTTTLSTNNATMGGNVTIGQLSGTTSLTGRLFPSGIGRVLPRVYEMQGDGDYSGISPADQEFAFLASGVITANRSLTLSVTGTSGFESIEIEMLHEFNTLTVKHPTTLATLLVMKNASGFANWARFRIVAIGTFAVVAKSVVP